MTHIINILDFSFSEFTFPSAGAIALSASLYFSRKSFWLVLSCVFLIVFQSLIFMNWDSLKFGTITNTILFVAIVIAFQRRRFLSTVRSEITDLFKADLIRGPIITTESLQDLPPIVRKWLIRSNVVGMRPIQALYIKQKGTMRPKPDGKWLPFTADQFINAENQGFIWQTTVNAGLLIPINARDKYLHGHGNMFIQALYTLPIANQGGPEIDQGTLMRFLAEIIWFPTAALARYIRWDYLSETTAMATIDNGETTVSGVFSFHPNGDVKGFEGMRYRDVNHHYTMEKWKIDVKSYRVFGSVRIADQSEVSWEKDGHTFTWLRLEISKAKFNYGRSPGDSATEKSEILERYFELK